MLNFVVFNVSRRSYNAQEARMALLKFTMQLANQAPLICCVITIPFMFIDF